MQKKGNIRRVFPKVGVVLIDGTAPHVVDAKNLGAVDEITYPL